MRQRVISMECGLRQLARARDALDAIPGVVAAEQVTGRTAVRVWYGDEVSEDELRDALRGCVPENVQID